MISQLHNTEVDARGLLQVLGENLYSTPEVALRELVQNAHDSCVRRRIEAGDGDGRIDVTADLEKRTLSIRDNGAGLTPEEIRGYLATIGAGYTRVLRESTAEESLIGAFGLGFLSAYVISERVDVVTTSYQSPGETWCFRSRDGLRYSLSEAENGPVGTEVKLHLKPRFSQFSGPDLVRSLLIRYCWLLPTPIYAPEWVNEHPPSWRSEESHPLRRRRLHLATAKLFEPYFDPLCAWEIEPADGLDVRGILWLQDGGSWATSDNRCVSIYVRGMLVDDDAPRALPEWAGFAGAAVECDALTPTASRETVQQDEVWHRMVLSLRQAMVTGLAAVAKNEPEAWRRVVSRHNEALRAATLVEPELFDILEGQLRLPTSEGDLRLPEVEQVTPGRVLLSVGDDAGYEHLIHRALSQPVLDGSRFGVMAFADRWCEAHGKKLVTLGTKSGNLEVFRRARPEPSRDELLKELLGDEGLQVVAAYFEPRTLPVVWVPDRDVELKKRIEDDKADQRISAGLLGLARHFTSTIEDDGVAKLFVNLDAPLIERLLSVPIERARSAATVLRSLAHLSARRGRSRQYDLGQALADLCSALDVLLGG